MIRSGVPDFSVIRLVLYPAQWFVQDVLKELATPNGMKMFTKMLSLSASGLKKSYAADAHVCMHSFSLGRS